jgi:hypothetical protein
MNWKLCAQVELLFLKGFILWDYCLCFKKTMFSLMTTAEDTRREETDGQRSVPGGLVIEVLFQVDSVMF